MVISPLGPYLLFVLALYATPGPATLSIAANGAAFGFKRTVKYVFGLIFGLLLIFLMVASGLGLLFATYPIVRQVFEWVSLAYIIYLAYKIIMSSSAHGGSAESLGFMQGLGLSMVNPKAYFAVIATISQFTKDGEEYLESLIAVTIWSTLSALILDLLWAYLGGYIGQLARQPRVAMGINWFFAILLVGSVVATMLYA